MRLKKNLWLTKSAVVARAVIFLFIACHATASNEAISSSAVIEAAKNEGALVIYSVLSNKAATPLVNSFQKLYPEIKVKYSGNQGTSETNKKFKEEFNSNNQSADIVWSSAVDLQIKLAVDGYATEYISPHARLLPAWSNFKNLVWGSTYEPLVLIYNKLLLPESKVPKNHADLIQFIKLNKPSIDNKIILFDPSKSGAGLFFQTLDYSLSPDSSLLYSELTKANAQTSAGTGEMLMKVNSGECVLGYNIIGSYALSRSKSDLTNIGIIYLQDYTPIISRAALISNKSSHPNAAKLWIDFMLSQEGQKIIANNVKLNSLRSDIDSEYTADAINKIIGPSAAKPIALDEKLIKHLQK